MSGHDEITIVTAFTEALLADSDRGDILPLEVYQARFSGYDAAIAREYAELVGASGGEERDQEPLATRYEDLGLIGAGGMGEVRRVFDRDLRRQVAMKTMRPGIEPSADEKHGLLRFVEEAQIASQLEHPGIVPVHDLGIDENGCSFFTMALVEGRTLRDVIDDVHHGRDGWTLARAVETLARVCDAVAFAHSRGVAHRDLKPSNVLVGEYGRTHVVDWGLARVVGEAQGSVASARADLGAAPGCASLTHRGTVLGTAHYMPPEQADGQLDRVGLASDAYALGAILYEVLTGRPPFSQEGGSSTSDVLEHLRRGPPQPVRSLQRDAPAELVAVCEKAMARNPAARYAGVDALAADLRAFLELRVVRAYHSGPLAELRKWIARNRLVAAAAIVAVGSLLVGMLLALVERHHANLAAVRAEASFHTAFDAIEEMSDAAWSGLVNVTGLDLDRRRVLERAIAFYTDFVAQRRDDPLVAEHMAEAQRRLGSLHHSLGDMEASSRALVEARRTIERLVAADPNPRLRSTLGWVLLDLARNFGDSKSIDEARELFAAARREFDSAIASDPKPLRNHRGRANSYGWLGSAEANNGDAERAVASHAAAVEQWQHIVDRSAENQDTFRLGEALGNLGAARIMAEDFDQAFDVLTRAREVLNKAITVDPDARDALSALAAASNGVVLVLTRRGEFDASIDVARDAIATRRSLVQRFPAEVHYRIELAGNLHNLAFSLQRKKRFDEALVLFREARHEQQSALAIVPSSVVAQRYLSYHLNAICQVALALGHHGEAIETAEALGPKPAGGVPARMAGTYAARCIPLVENDAALDAAERDLLRRDYSRRATALVRGAIEAGWNDDAALRAAPFTRLRGEPEFEQLLDR